MTEGWVTEMNEERPEETASPEATAMPEGDASPETTVSPEESASPEETVAPETLGAPEGAIPGVEEWDHWTIKPDDDPQ